MKFIKFCGEVLSVPANVTFWIQNRGSDYCAPFCVNMSFLEKQGFDGDPALDSIIRSEAYESLISAQSRLDFLLNILND